MPLVLDAGNTTEYKPPIAQRAQHLILAAPWNKLRQDPLYLNSFYLMASTGVMASLGFVYWLLAARLYTSAEVGIAATLISIMTYISTISQLGINAGLMRFLPQSKDKLIRINTSLTFATIASIAVAIGTLFGIGWLVPKLAYLSTDVFTSASFVLFMVFGTLNVMYESILIALANSGSVLLKNSLLSLSKVGFLFLFAAFGSYGLFSSSALAAIIATLCAVAVLASRNLYRPRLCVNYAEIREMAGYSIGNYIANTVGNFPQYMLPSLITTLINPRATAYFNVAMSYAVLLFSIPLAICNSLLVEGATHEDQIRKITIRAIKLIALILMPAVAIVILFGEKGLSLFGSEYSENSAQLLSMLAISSIFVAISTVCQIILNLKRRVKEIIYILTASTLIVMALCWVLIGDGLLGIGSAWTIGQAITSVIYIIVVFRRNEWAPWRQS